MNAPPLLTPEVRILFRMVRGTPPDEGAEEIVWPRLVWLAGVERSVPLLWQRMNDGTLPEAPPEIQDVVRKQAMVTEFRMLHLEQRLYKTLDAFAERGIEAIPLKGAALAKTVYRGFPDRPMTDLDLLVRGEQAAEAQALAREIGWSGMEKGFADEVYEDHHHMAPLDGQSGTYTSLELHTSLVAPHHPFLFAEDDVWRDAREIAMNGRTLRIPSAEHLLLHNCTHFAWSHALRSGAMRAVRDTDALARSGNVDWAAFPELAHRARAATCCYWTFRLARRLIDAEVPDEVMTALQPPGGRLFLNRLERHFTRETLRADSICPSVRLLRYAWHAGIRPKWSGHGDSTPWTDAQPFVAKNARGKRSPFTAVRAHMRAARQWRYYCGLMLGRGSVG